MLTNRQRILEEMDQLILDPSVPRSEKYKRLSALCQDYWQDVFPERGTEAYHKLSTSERSARWAFVRAEEAEFWKQIRNPQMILEILDWPVVGGSLLQFPV
jgi:hypothetical protein